VGLERYWLDYIDFYVHSPSYWYQPKGLAVKRENLPLIKKRLQILRKYRGQNWKQAQKKYTRQLERVKSVELRKPKKEYTSADYSAIARMNKVIFNTLGLAWVDPAHTIYITPFGDRFLTTRRDCLADLVADQLQKFQLANPSLAGVSSDIRLFPHCFLLELLTWTDYELTTLEFVLFVSRACEHADLPKFVEHIERWRHMDEHQQDEIIDRLGTIPVIRKGRAQLRGRRTSLFNTIRLDASYVFRLHAVPKYMSLEEKEKGGATVKIDAACRSEVADIVNRHHRLALFTEYDNELDWISFYGDPAHTGTVQDAIDYYEKRHRVAQASEALLVGKRRGIVRSSVEPEEYTDRRVREKLLEVYLADNLDVLEEGLTLEGRQVSTPTGPLDLLARDGKGRWVVIELKRDRASDRVVGQLQRYVGYVRTEHAAGGKNVRGMIVAHKIDKALRMSIRDNITFPINLYVHDSQFRANIRPVAV